MVALDSPRVRPAKQKGGSCTWVSRPGIKGPGAHECALRTTAITRGIEWCSGQCRSPSNGDDPMQVGRPRLYEPGAHECALRTAVMTRNSSHKKRQMRRMGACTSWSTRATNPARWIYSNLERVAGLGERSRSGIGGRVGGSISALVCPLPRPLLRLRSRA